MPVVAYNVPGRTGLNMLPETVLALAEDPRMCAVKEASGSLDQACEILRHRPAGFSVLSGEDSLALPMIACGADGVIAAQRAFETGHPFVGAPFRLVGSVLRGVAWVKLRSPELCRGSRWESGTDPQP